MSRTQDVVLLLTRLLQRTSAGELDWTRMPSPNQFRSNSGVYTFILSKDILGSGIRLQIFNSEGISVEDFRSDQNPFIDSSLNLRAVKSRLEALWSSVNGNSDELKKILKSL